MQKIEIFENGLQMIFGVNENDTLLLLSLTDGVDPDYEAPYAQNQFNILFPATELLTTGDAYEGYGVRHHQCGMNDGLKYISHTDTVDDEGRVLDFTLKSSRLTVHQFYHFYNGTKVVASWMEIENHSDTNVGLEYVSSFCLGGLGKKGKKSFVDKLELMIPYSGWCSEFHWTRNTLRDSGFNPINWQSSSRIKVTNTGSWSGKEYMPMGILYNNEMDESYMWQIENNGSWHWEIFDCHSSAQLRLSGPCESENQWWKNLKPGERFVGVRAAMAVSKGDFGAVVREMTKYRRNACGHIIDKEMPVFFNDYMCCLNANPTTQTVLPLIEKAAALGAEYYVLDGGWYDAGFWWDNVGEWKESPERFPNGLAEVFDSIRAHGMKPGIWLEPEVMGVECPLAPEFEDCFFVRHGVKVNNRGRYQLDFRKEKTIRHLNQVVDRLVNDYGIRFIKLDYNVDTGCGTEVDADSFGDGLLEHNRAFLKWIDSLYERHPQLQIENCSAGGMRMDYASSRHFALQSISDAWRYDQHAEKSVMAPTGELPEKMGIWVVPMRDQTPAENAFAAVNAMLHRMYISGEMAWLCDEQFEQLKRAVDVYKQIRKDILGSIPYFPCGICLHQDIWSVSARVSGDGQKLYVAVGTKGEETHKQISLKEFSGRMGEAKILFSAGGTISLDGDTLTVDLPQKGAMLIQIALKN